MALTSAVIRRRQGRVPRCENCGEWDCRCSQVVPVINRDELPVNREWLDPWQPDKRDLVAFD